MLGYFRLAGWQTDESSLVFEIGLSQQHLVTLNEVIALLVL